MAKDWRDLSDGQRAAALALMSVQVALAVSAWTDLATRPSDQVIGRKSTWAAVIAINVVGPVLYFTKGRRRAVGG